MNHDKCNKCGQELRTGDPVIGWDFSDKQEHIHCPKPAELAESAKAGQ
jgi:hypothetical protein